MSAAAFETLPDFLYLGRGGHLYFRGTFVPVDFLWNYLAEGNEVSTFLAGFPRVTKEQVESALRLAGSALKEKYLPDEYSL